MFLFSTEVTSSNIISDNPLFQRTLKAYEIVSPSIHGNVLEIGCGEGYGVKLLHKKANQLTLIDKSKYNIDAIQEQYPNVTCLQERIPPLSKLETDSFDVVVSFQVIEHIKESEAYLKEIYRVLKPGGKAYITTPNAVKTVARNPWHYKEFNYQEMEALIQRVFKKYTIDGIEGNSKTDAYYEENKVAVERFLRYDIFNFEKILPSFLLRIPYEVANRMNRKALLKQHTNLVHSITLEDYNLKEFSEASLDFFCTLEK